MFYFFISYWDKQQVPEVCTTCNSNKGTVVWEKCAYCFTEYVIIKGDPNGYCGKCRLNGHHQAEKERDQARLALKDALNTIEQYKKDSKQIEFALENAIKNVQEEDMGKFFKEEQ